jgi:predicted RNase H-like HicB family nuclease
MSTTDKHLSSIIHHLGYRIVIGWSTSDKCYKAYTPEWREDIIQPCAQGNTYEEALNKAKEVLGIFVKAANDEESQK